MKDHYKLEDVEEEGDESLSWVERSIYHYEKAFIQFASNIEEEVSESFLLANFIK